MNYINRIASLQDYAYSNLYQNIELVVYSAVCFFVPFFMGHPQFFVGALVNAALIAAALNLKNYKLLPVIMIPSIGVLSRGLIFGPFSKFLVYLIPFIWIGNAILVFSFKHFNLNRKKSYLTTLIIGAGAKAGFLFLSAFALYKIGAVPVVFLTAMGVVQLTTALAGGAIAFAAHNIKKKFY